MQTLPRPSQHAVTGPAQTWCATKLAPGMLEYETRRDRLLVESHRDVVGQGPAGPHPWCYQKSSTNHVSMKDDQRNTGSMVAKWIYS